MLSRILISLTTVFWLLLPQTINAETISLVEAYSQLPNKSKFAISPSGTKLAYRDTKLDRDMLVVIDLTTKKILQAANIKDVNPNSIYFVSEQTVIMTATRNIRIGSYKGRHDSSWAYALNLDNGKVHALLTQGYGIHEGQTQLGRIVGISEDGKYAFMPAYRSAGRYNLYKVDLLKQRKPKLHVTGSADAVDFFVDRQGQVLARERYHQEDNLHRLESMVDGEWKVIYREEVEIPTRGFHGLTKDFKSIIYSQVNEETGFVAYYKMDLVTGETSEPIFSRPNQNVESLLTNIQRDVYGARFGGFTPSYEFFDPKLNARLKGIQQALPNNSFYIQDYSADWDHIVFYMDGEYSAGDYILYKNGGIELLATGRDFIQPELVSNVVETTITARDNLVIPVLLTMPNSDSKQPYPTILLPHGGPQSYDKKGFDYMAQYFSRKGYLVVQPQFRGSDGFGLDFILKGKGEWGRKMQDDLTDTINTLVANKMVDSNKVCIVGASYGGYAAMAGAAFTPDLYKCAVAINGVSDINKMMKQDRANFGSDHWAVSYWETMISNGTVDEKHLFDISPINHVKNIKAPMLLIHGEYDEVVSVKQSREMFDALEDADKEVSYIELDRGDHSLSSQATRMETMQAIDSFINKYNPIK